MSINALMAAPKDASEDVNRERRLRELLVATEEFADRTFTVYDGERRTYGEHLLWLAFMVAQTAGRGPRDFVRRRLLCFSLFWHALDIIWVALFTVVYLRGAGQ